MINRELGNVFHDRIQCTRITTSSRVALQLRKCTFVVNQPNACHARLEIHSHYFCVQWQMLLATNMFAHKTLFSGINIKVYQARKATLLLNTIRIAIQRKRCDTIRIAIQTKHWLCMLWSFSNTLKTPRQSS